MGIMEKGAVLLDGTIHIPTELQAEAAPLLEEHIRLSRAEAGCIRFEVVQDLDVAGRFIVSEAFEDQASFDAHQARVKASAWGEFTKEFLRIYETKTLD